MKEQISAIVKTAIYGMVAASAGTVAFLFAVVAAFLWMQQRYDTIVACLAVGGLFLLAAVIALVSLAIARRRATRRQAHEEAEAAKAVPSWLADPAAVLAAIQVVRTIGLGRLIPVALAGVVAFGAAGLMGGRTGRRNRDRDREAVRDTQRAA